MSLLIAKASPSSPTLTPPVSPSPTSPSTTSPLPNSPSPTSPPATSPSPVSRASNRSGPHPQINIDLIPKMIVVPWHDDVLDSTGHDPRSQYVERFWLGVLGPSATWLLRSLAWGLESSPDGFSLTLVDMAKALGLSDRLGRHSPFVRAMNRTCQFELASIDESHPSGAVLLRTRRKLPWLSHRMTLALPDTLRAEHQQWIESAAELTTRRRTALRSVSLDSRREVQR